MQNRQLWIPAVAGLCVILNTLAGAPLLATSASLATVVALVTAWVLGRTKSASRFVFAVVLVGALLLIPAGGGQIPALILLTTMLQVTACLVLPRRPAIVLVLFACVTSATGAALAMPTEVISLATVTLGLGAVLLRVMVSKTPDGQKQDTAPGDTVLGPQVTRLAGTTRRELNQVKSELDIMTSLLRREASSRQNAESQLFEACRVKEAFLATMSHELRTPLHQIIGYSELLLDEAEDSGANELCGDVSRIQDAATNLFEIISNVLDQSSIESGSLTTSPEPVEVAPFVLQLTRGFATQARSRGNTLRLRCPDDIGELVSDQDKLHTILKNLLSNACKFTENGTVRFSAHLDTEAPTPSYVFQVHDTGIGIDPEEMERLFQPFEQADGSRTRSFDGAGLGLAVSRNLSAILGATLTAESAPGQGSTFTLRVPKQWPGLTRTNLFVRSLCA